MSDQYTHVVGSAGGRYSGEPMDKTMVTARDVGEAVTRIRAAVHETPLVTCRAIDELAGATLFFKCENFQRVGAFKIRGAMNAALSPGENDRAKGLATHSSGNHAQAVALAARSLGVPAHIVMPRTSPAVKVKAVEGYGALITFCEPTQADREATLERVVHDTGAAFIHPYDDERVIAGQGTVAWEFISQLEERGVRLDALVGPVGGGGLMSGTAIAANHRSPGTRLFAAEPCGADDASRSFHSGRREVNDAVETLADGLRTNLSDRTFAILSRHLEDVLTVDDAQIVGAMRLIYERAKLVVEPSAATALAAVLANRDRFARQRVGVILSGGNVDLEAFFTSLEGMR